MSARTILAVRTGRTKFKGVFHEEGNEPWVLGDHLLSRVIRARGDIAKVVETIVHETPWGWVSLPREVKSSLKKRPNRRLFSQNVLQKRNETPMDWVYLFDVDARTLTISAADEVDRTGVAPEPYVVITFNERGRPSPRQIVPPPPPWPSQPVAEAWEGDVEELTALRTRALEVTDAWCSRIRLPAPDLETLVGALLGGVLGRTLKGDLTNVYVPAPHGEGHVYWTVRLLETTLHYPSPAWRETLREHDAMYPADAMAIWAPPTRTATLDLSTKTIAAGLGEDEWPLPHLSRADIVAAVLRGVAAGLFPRSDIDSEGLRVFRWMKVVEEVQDPDREVRITQQQQEEDTKEVQNTLLLKWGWDLLDWLRASQITERVVELAPEPEPADEVDEVDDEPEADDDDEIIEEEVVYVDEAGNPVDEHGNPLPAAEVEEEVMYVDEEGNPVDEHGNPLPAAAEDEVVMYVDEDGNPVDEYGNPLDEHGNPVEVIEEVVYVDEEGFAVDEFGTPLYDEHGRRFRYD